MNPKDLLDIGQREAVKDAIARAEKATSGEIRVHIDSKCKGDVFEQGVKVFSKLKMHETELRNGVLFYLAVKNQEFAIVADKGINEKVLENYWNEMSAVMMDHFKNSRYSEGLIYGISEVGNRLKEYFPYDDADTNELSDEISFGE